jgi:hypothetical protein
MRPRPPSTAAASDGCPVQARPRARAARLRLLGRSTARLSRRSPRLWSPRSRPSARRALVRLRAGRIAKARKAAGGGASGVGSPKKHNRRLPALVGGSRKYGRVVGRHGSISDVVGERVPAPRAGRRRYESGKSRVWWPLRSPGPVPGRGKASYIRLLGTPCRGSTTCAAPPGPRSTSPFRSSTSMVLRPGSRLGASIFQTTRLGSFVW